MTFATYPSLADRVVLITGGAHRHRRRPSCAPSRRKAPGRLPRHRSEAPARRSARARATRAARPAVPPLRRHRHRRAARRDRARRAPSSARSACSSTTPPTTSATTLAEVTPEQFDWIARRQPRHVFFAAQAVRPQMKRARRRLDHQPLLDRLERRRRRRCRPMPPPRRRSSASPARWPRARRPRQHPRQRHRARRGDDRAAAAALVHGRGQSIADGRARRRSRRASRPRTSPARRCSSPPTTARASRGSAFRSTGHPLD